MNKPSILTDIFGRRSLSIVLALVLLPIITLSLAMSEENDGSERQKTIRRVVQIFIDTGKEEYGKGYFEGSVITFQMAQEYEKDLTVAVREQLGGLLKKSQIAVLERQSARDTFRRVDDLIKHDQLSQAKTNLEKIKDNEYLTKEELKQIAEVFRQIDAQVLAAQALLEKAVEQKVAYIPGSVFSTTGGHHNTMRLSYANLTPGNIREGVKRLFEVVIPHVS